MITVVHIKGNYHLLHVLCYLLLMEAGAYLLLHGHCSFSMAAELFGGLCLFSDLQ